MKFLAVKRLFTSVIVLTLILACSEKDEETSDESLTCKPLDSAVQKKFEFEDPDFGDGTDGELYLASGETLFLEERVYNFNNVYLEVDATLEASDLVTNESGTIRINALGGCEFFGNIKLQHYNGVLEINCYSHISLGGVVDVPNGEVSITTSSETLTSADDLTALEAGSTIGGSISIDDEFVITGTSTIIGGGSIDVEFCESEN